MSITVAHLISKSLVTQNVSSFRRINIKMFNEIDAAYIEWILAHVSQYHKIPTLNMFREQFPSFIPVEHDGTIEFLFDRVSEKLCDSYAVREISAAKHLSLGLLQGVIEDTKIVSGSSLLYQDVDPADYFTAQRVLTTSVPFIRDTIGTITGSDFLLIVGRMKAQKTHISQILLIDLLTKYNGILFTNEITELEYSAKLDALLAGTLISQGFDTKVFRTQDETQHVREALKAARAYRSTHLKQLKIYASISSVDELYSAVNASEFPVEFIMIDGMHYMGSNAGSTGDKAQSMRGVSNATKMFCIAESIPVIAVTQSNRAAEGKEKADASTIALSDALAQDATAVYYTYKIPQSRLVDLPETTTVATISPIVSRFGGEDGYKLKTDWSKTYTEWMIPNEPVDGVFNNSELDVIVKKYPPIVDSLLG